jgi:hypothetical protein
MFSGSYDPEDVTFLLKQVELESTSVAEKERLIQSGRRHYSQMITREQLPSPVYLRVFHQAMAREQARFAGDLLALARHLAAARSGPVTLVSLARAGTPVGVLLARTLRRHFGRPATHYSLSIIRDRGIDEVALRFIVARHPAESVAFVDGWTAKGVIAAELHDAVAAFNNKQGTRLDPGLFVVADLGGVAAWAATTEDYLIPSSILGATVSGLVSRSILNARVIGPGDFHGCLFYKEFEPHDLSRWFVDRLAEEIVRQVDVAGGERGLTNAESAWTGQRGAALLTLARERFAVRTANHVKPGVGEATRVLLRRLPECVLVRDPAAPEVAHLLVLAGEKGVRVVVEPALPYRAAALVKELKG